MQDSLGFFNLAGLLLLGGALLWAVRLVYDNRHRSSDDVVKRALTTAGWTAIWLGMIGVIFSLCGVFGPVICVVAVPVIAMVVSRYRRAEQRALLDVLAVAAEKEIPLPEAARAFADRRDDQFGHRALKFAELLEAGMPTDEALRRARIRLSTDELLAVRSGLETGTLAAALRPVVQRDDELDSLSTSIVERFFYFALLFFAMTLILSWMMIFIIPTYSMMYDDFGLELPTATKMLIGAANGLKYFGLLLAPLNLALLGLLAIATLNYVGWLPRDLPLVWRFTLRWDAALVMRALARAVRQQRPMGEALFQLGWQFPKMTVRSRLHRAAAHVGQGGDWCEAMQSAGLLKSTEVALFQAAQRAGNLDWALEEMADGNVRRMAYRWQSWSNVLFIAALLLFGGCAFAIAVGLFQPLVHMIEGLA